MRTFLIAIVGLLAALAGQQARALVTVGSVDTPSSAQEVEVVGGLAYVVGRYSYGLRVIDFGPEYVQAPEPVPTLSTWCHLVLVAAMLVVGMSVWRWQSA